MPETREGQSSFREVYYAPEDVTAMLDASLTDSSDTDDNKSSASDSESDFDLSNPEAGVPTDEDELFISQPDKLSSNQQFASRDAFPLYRADSLPSNCDNNEEASDMVTVEADDPVETDDPVEADDTATSNVSRAYETNTGRLYRGQSTMRQRGRGRACDTSVRSPCGGMWQRGHIT